MKKKGVLLCLTVCMLLWGFPGLMFAQDNGTEETETPGVRGKAYSCFFYSYYDVFDSDISFSETIKMTFSNFSGNGIYIPIGLSFSGIYLSVNETLGQDTGDIIIYITGIPAGPFIFGSGFIIMEYTWISPFFFHGLRSDL